MNNEPLPTQGPVGVAVGRCETCVQLDAGEAWAREADAESAKIFDKEEQMRRQRNADFGIYEPGTVEHTVQQICALAWEIATANGVARVLMFRYGLKNAEVIAAEEEVQKGQSELRAALMKALATPNAIGQGSAACGASPAP